MENWSYRIWDENIRKVVLKHKKIAICPMGEMGMLVKNILNNRYGVRETYVIDNMLSNVNPNIIRMEELKNKDVSGLVVILATLSQNVRQELKREWNKLEIDCELLDFFTPVIIDKEEDYEYFRTIRRLLETKQIVNKKLMRVGAAHDGGYVMCEDFKSCKAAYSFGIGNDVSWDAEIASYGLNIYMYDPTIERLPQENERFHFYKIGIAAEDAIEDRVCSLRSLMIINGHEKAEKFVLKMDVEGAEWEFINSCNGEIEQFSQIVFELHGICDKEKHQKIISALEKMNQTHQVVWVHGNNFDIVEKAREIVMPNVLEVAYVNRKEYEFQNDIREYPTILDAPNYNIMEDIYLGRWGMN